MSTIGSGRGGGGVYVKFLENVSSSGGQSIRYVLSEPCRYFGLQVVTATSSAAVDLQGSIASSSDAPLTTLISWSSDTSGSILSTESTAPIAVITGIVNDSSSDDVEAWFSASP